MILRDTRFLPKESVALARTQIIENKWLAPRPGVLGACAAVACLALASMALAAPGDTASAALSNAEGEPVGSVQLTETANGTLVVADLENLPEGAHGFHIHETGACEAPFKSAGGHYNPAGASHGFASPAGSHAGDLPNLQVPESGEVTAEFFKENLEVSDRLLDYGTMENEGAAIVIHAAADDYETDPAGDAGERIACGVLKGNV